VSYINASFIPVFDTGKYRRGSRHWNAHGSSFRIGVGPYVGYRLGSHSRQVYLEDGDNEVNKVRDHFYLNNLRYGARLQFGLRSVDFFFNYDLNELFVENKGPKLNAFSFGIVF
jgi:hypothetical protein